MDRSHNPAGTARAIVFDLFHTLVDTEHLRPPGFDAIASVAAICGVDGEPLREFWSATYVQRETSPVDLVDLVVRYCETVGVHVASGQRAEIDETFGVSKDDALRAPEAGVVDILAELAGATSIAVLSNCHEREVRCWAESPLAGYVDVFGRSTRIGAMKPEPVAYQWVLDRLGVRADEAVYVGNGSSDELGGARRAGFGSVIHCNVFDRSNGLVSAADQRARADSADQSVETIRKLSSTLTGLVEA